MNWRMVELRPGDVVVTMNRNALLKFIGWTEAHRPPGEWEPTFLGGCLSALNSANEGYTLAATVTCAACGDEHDISDPRTYYDSDAGGWFCTTHVGSDELAAAEEAGR